MPLTLPRAAAALLLTLAAPALAQSGIGSEGYRFLKAVREGDGPEASKYMNSPSSTIVNVKDVTSGEGALHIVTKRRDLGWMNLLLLRGARPDLQSRNGSSALHITAELGFADGARVLLDRGARVDLENRRGETALIIATLRRDMAMARLLLEAGASPDHTDDLAGKSARDYARDDNRGAVLLRLIETTKAKPRAKKYGP